MLKHLVSYCYQASPVANALIQFVIERSIDCSRERLSAFFAYRYRWHFFLAQKNRKFYKVIYCANISARFLKFNFKNWISSTKETRHDRGIKDIVNVFLN